MTGGHGVQRLQKRLPGLGEAAGLEGLATTLGGGLGRLGGSAGLDGLGARAGRGEARATRAARALGRIGAGVHRGRTLPSTQVSSTSGVTQAADRALRCSAAARAAPPGSLGERVQRRPGGRTAAVVERLERPGGEGAEFGPPGRPRRRRRGWARQARWAPDAGAGRAACALRRTRRKSTTGRGDGGRGFGHAGVERRRGGGAGVSGRREAGAGMRDGHGAGGHVRCMTAAGGAGGSTERGTGGGERPGEPPPPPRRGPSAVKRPAREGGRAGVPAPRGPRPWCPTGRAPTCSPGGAAGASKRGTGSAPPWATAARRSRARASSVG